MVAAAADYFFDRRWKADPVVVPLAAIPIERTQVNRRSAEIAADLLDDGWNLVIFPEGGRSPDGWAQEFRRPAPPTWPCAPGAPVVPVYLHGTRQILPKRDDAHPGGSGTENRAACSAAAEVTVIFGPPLRPDEGEDARRFGARIERAVELLAHEVATRLVDGAPARTPARPTPALHGPDAVPWRRAWALGALGRPRPSGAWPDVRLAPAHRTRRRAAGPAPASGQTDAAGDRPADPGRLGPTERRRPAAGPARPRASRASRSARSACSPPVLEGGEPVRPDGPAEEQVGQGGVAGEDRPVQVGADDPARPRAVGPVRRCRLPARPGRAAAAPAPTVVRPPWFSNPVSRPTAGRAAASTTISPTARRPGPFARGHVEQAEAVVGRAVARREGAAERSGSPAHTPRTTAPVGDRPGQRPVLGQGARPPAPAGRPRRRRGCRGRPSGSGRSLERLEQLDLDAPPLGPPGQHQPVAAVAVGAEEVRVDDGDAAAAGPPRCRSRGAWPAGGRGRRCSCR